VTTIVATKDRIVADSKTSNGDVKWPSRKIDRVGERLFGCAGDVASIERFLKWIRNGDRRPRIGRDEFAALEVNPGGLFLWDEHLVPMLIDRDHHAIGSGASAAFGALAMGATPEQAVEIACQIDDKSEGPLQVERLRV
jgi:ATP-dependent protease HslVU (ClpYQ) peptidase subunit